MAKPTTLPAWNTNQSGPSTTTPPNGVKSDGVPPKKKLPAQYLNWVLSWIYKWCLYLDGLTGEALTWTVLQTFTAGLSSDGGITETTGDIVADAGNIEATNGNISGVIAKALHFEATGGTPLYATVNGGAGVGASSTGSTGKDSAGLLVVTTAGVPGAGLNVATVTFDRTYTAVPKVVLLLPANANALEVIGRIMVDVSSITINGFTVTNNSLVGLTSGITYKWYYAVIA